MKKWNLRAQNANFIGWSAYMPLGLVDGAMGAFPESSGMSLCNDDSTSMREYFEDGIAEFEADDFDAGAEQFYNGIKLTENLY